MINRNDEAAFPVPIGLVDMDRVGMSLRDWFAGQFVSAIDAGMYGREPDIEKIAKYAYYLADAMMEARKEAKK